MATLQLKRAAVATPVAIPAIGLDGELAFAAGGFTNAPAHAAAGNDLVITAAGTMRTIVGPTRQVELIGAQIISGAKTFNLASFLLLGGAAGEVLSTTGTGGVLEWITPGAGGSTYVFGVGLTETAGTVDLDEATAAIIGGVSVPPGTALTLTAGALGLTVAAAAAIETGTDNILPITPLGLRSQLGLPLANLDTTATTIVPAINELKSAVDALSGNLQFGGTYDVAGNAVTAGGGSPFDDGPLVAATAAMTGWYLIVSSPATGAPGPLPPAGNYAPGDWLIVDAAPAYIHLELGSVPILVDNVSIIGDGQTTPLEVAEIDGGTY
jgi:hypothetical protein